MDSNTLDFTEYVETDNMLESAGDALARQTMWLVNNAATVADGLPALGKRGAPVADSNHQEFIARLDALFPSGLSDSARGKRITRAFNLCRIVAANAPKKPEDVEYMARYMARVAEWRVVASKTSKDVREAMEGKKRTPRLKPPGNDGSGNSEGSEESETIETPQGSTGPKTFTFDETAKGILSATRYAINLHAKGATTDAARDQLVKDMEYAIALLKASVTTVAA